MDTDSFRKNGRVYKKRNAANPTQEEIGDCVELEIKSYGKRSFKPSGKAWGGWWRVTRKGEVSNQEFQRKLINTLFEYLTIHLTEA